MRKNKRKLEAPSALAQPVEPSVEKQKLLEAIGYLHKACEAVNALYIMAKKQENPDEEMYYYMRFLNLDQVYWSLVNH